MVKDVVSFAKVWLSFNAEESIEVPVAADTASPVMEPASPALSDTTVVGEEAEEYFGKVKDLEIPIIEAQPFSETEVHELPLDTRNDLGLYEHFFGSAGAPSTRFPLVATPVSTAAPLRQDPATATGITISPKTINLYSHFFGTIDTTASRRSNSLFPLIPTADLIPKTEPITTSYTRVFAPLHPFGVPRRRKNAVTSTD